MKCKKCKQPMRRTRDDGKGGKLANHVHVLYAGVCMKHEHYCTVCGEHYETKGCNERITVERRIGARRLLPVGWTARRA